MVTKWPFGDKRVATDTKLAILELGISYDKDQPMKSLANEISQGENRRIERDIMLQKSETKQSLEE